MSVGRRARFAASRGERLARATMVPGLTVTRIVKQARPDYTVGDQEIIVYGGPDCPYGGAHKLQTYEPDALMVSSGGRPVVTQEYRLHVPVGAGPFQIGDLAHVPGYAQPFLVDGLLDKTYMTAQRLKVTVQPNREGSGADG